VAENDDKKASDEVASEYLRRKNKFDSVASVGETEFRFKSWPAWIVYPNRKTITPVHRMYIGSWDGDVLLEKPVVSLAYAHLLANIASSLQFDLKLADEMTGFSLDVPFSKSDYLDKLAEAKVMITDAERLIGKIKFNSTADELASESSPSDENQNE